MHFDWLSLRHKFPVWHCVSPVLQVRTLGQEPPAVIFPLQAPGILKGTSTYPYLLFRTSAQACAVLMKSGGEKVEVGVGVAVGVGGPPSSVLSQISGARPVRLQAL